MSAIKQLDAVSEAFRSFDFTEREIATSQARLAQLTGICPKCGDAGWWIDDSGFHTCECPAGVGERAKMAAEDAEAEAERERAQELKEQQSRDEEQPLGQRYGASYGANSAGRT